MTPRFKTFLVGIKSQLFTVPYKVLHGLALPIPSNSFSLLSLCIGYSSFYGSTLKMPSCILLKGYCLSYFLCISHRYVLLLPFQPSVLILNSISSRRLLWLLIQTHSPKELSFFSLCALLHCYCV